MDNRLFFLKTFPKVVYKLPNRNLIHELYQLSNWKTRRQQIYSPIITLFFQGKNYSCLQRNPFLFLGMLTVLKQSFIKDKPVVQTKATVPILAWFIHYSIYMGEDETCVGALV